MRIGAKCAKLDGSGKRFVRYYSITEEWYVGRDDFAISRSRKMTITTSQQDLYLKCHSDGLPAPPLLYLPEPGSIQDLLGSALRAIPLRTGGRCQQNNRKCPNIIFETYKERTMYLDLDSKTPNYHRSGYFDFGALPYMYLSKNWWASSDDSKVTLLSGRSGKVGHVSINQLGIFLLRESKTKNSKLYSHLPHTVDRDIIKLMGMVSVDQTKCDLSEPSMLAERMGKVAGYHCHSIYELHPVAREYHTQKRRNKEMKDKDRPWMFCPCRERPTQHLQMILQFTHNLKSETVDHRGVCEAADKFNQTFKHWKFAFHKDQDMVEYQSVHQTEETFDDEIQMTNKLM
eukprot:sb/3466346/